MISLNTYDRFIHTITHYHSILQSSYPSLKKILILQYTCLVSMCIAFKSIFFNEYLRRAMGKHIICNHHSEKKLTIILIVPFFMIILYLYINLRS